MEEEKGWGGRVMFMSFALIGTRVFENLSYPSPSAVPFLSSRICPLFFTLFPCLLFCFSSFFFKWKGIICVLSILMSKLY